MTYQLPPLPWLRAFDAAARHGSFTAAAAELGLTQAAVSHQVRSLETRLGYPLFERLARSLRLTDMGKAYLAPVRKAFDELAASTAGLFGPIGEVVLNVRVPVSFAVLWLSPRIGAFKQAHPNLHIRLYSAIWADALPADRIDVDIRFGHGRWPGCAVELIRNEPSVAVSGLASAVRDPSAMAGEELIQIMGLEDDWLRFFRLAGVEGPPLNTVMTVDTSLAALELAAAGLGHALVLESFAAPYLAAARIKQAFDRELPQDQSHFLLLREGSKRLKPEVVLFRDWLLDLARST